MSKNSVRDKFLLRLSLRSSPERSCAEDGTRGEQHSSSRKLAVNAEQSSGHFCEAERPELTELWPENSENKEIV